MDEIFRRLNPGLSKFLRKNSDFFEKPRTNRPGALYTKPDFFYSKEEYGSS
jgi:hypothetical protein